MGFHLDDDADDGGAVGDDGKIKSFGLQDIGFDAAIEGVVVDIGVVSVVSVDVPRRLPSQMIVGGLRCGR